MKVYVWVFIMSRCEIEECVALLSQYQIWELEVDSDIMSFET